MTAKPDLTRIWASGAAGADVIDPDTTTPGKFAAGWVVEVPEYQHFNFLQNFFTAALAHINEQGIAQWDGSTTYPIGGLTKGSDTELYKALISQAGNDPVGDAINWEQALFSSDPSGDSVALGENALQNATGGDNTAVGSNAGASIVGGNRNTAIGSAALDTNVSGNDNTAVGYRSLDAYTGSSSVAVGRSAASAMISNPITAVGKDALENCTGNANTAIGYRAGDEITTGWENTAVGQDALGSATTGNYNTAIGMQALLSGVLLASTGEYNTAVGAAALAGCEGKNNTSVGGNSATQLISGNDNTAVGYSCLSENITGDSNTTIGFESLYFYTSSGAVAVGSSAAYAQASNPITAVGYNALTLSTGSGNTAVGYLAGDAVTTAINCTAIGHQALRAASGDECTAVGSDTLASATGNNNTAVGSGAASSVTSGANNTYIGRYNGGSHTTDSNRVFISDGSGNICFEADASQNVVLGGDLTIPEHIKHTGDVTTLFGFGTTSYFNVDIAGTTSFAVGTVQAAFKTIDVLIDPTKKLFLDGGVNTYIQEIFADVVAVVTNGVEAMVISEFSADFIGDINMESGSQLYIDGEDGTFIQSDVAGNIRFVVTEVEQFNINANGIGILAGDRIYLDGVSNTGDTYITETSSGVIDIWADGDNTLRITNTGIDLQDKEIRRPILKDYAIAHAANTVSGNAVTVTYSTNQSSFVDLEPATGAVTITLSGGPPGGGYGEMQVYVQQDTTASRTVVFAGGTFKWPNGVQPVQTATADKVDIYNFSTFDGGTTWYATASQNH